MSHSCSSSGGRGGCCDLSAPKSNCLPRAGRAGVFRDSTKGVEVYPKCTTSTMDSSEDWEIDGSESSLAPIGGMLSSTNLGIPPLTIVMLIHTRATADKLAIN